MNKPIIILGGGTFYHVRNHLSIAAPAFGTTARWIHEQVSGQSNLFLTRMADSQSKIETNQDVGQLVADLLLDKAVKCIIMNVAMCDYDGQIGVIPSGKHAQRLRTKKGEQVMQMVPSDKVISGIKSIRPDIFLVGFKTTTHHSPTEQKERALDMIEKSKCDLVFANDTVTRNNMLLLKDGTCPASDTNRQVVLQELILQLQKQNF